MAKFLIFQVTEEDCGRLGVTKRDIGKWGVLVSGCIYYCKTREDALKLRAVIDG